MKILEQLLQAIRSASVFNSEVQVAPACILWPDRERQWEAIIPRLQEHMPELCVLGDFAPEQRRGPAIWLRCALAGKCLEDAHPDFSKVVEEARAAYGKADVSPLPAIPILYLPGVGRQDLRAVETCPEYLKPLAELQYRGVIWSQINAKDWTILAFLKSDQGGLNLDVGKDAETKHSMQLALYKLLDEDLGLLKGKRLDKDYFNTLLTSGDPTRDLLLWIDQGDSFKNSCAQNEWHAFVEVIRSQMGFDPDKDGQLSAIEKLATHEGPWSPVWQRYLEAPQRYPSIPGLIRGCSPPLPTDLFADQSGWPQLNERKEHELEAALKKLVNLPPHDARKVLRELNREHRERRTWVWAELGESPLAHSIGYLGKLAKLSEQPLAVGTIEDMLSIYKTSAWEVDDAALKSLVGVQDAEHIEAVQTALRSVYLPWLEDAARHLQKVVRDQGYPGVPLAQVTAAAPEKGEVIFFVDGLRFDLAQRLLAKLETKKLSAESQHKWSALPSVTATAKPAVSPVCTQITGNDVSDDFEASVKSSGQSLKGGYHFKKLLTDAGWQILSAGDTGDATGFAWTEMGEIDKTGHSSAWKLANEMDGMIHSVSERISELINAGWKTVKVVTDHGFLLLPGGLPITKLPNVLSENTWGRCAAIKPGAKSDEAHYSWFWNPAHSFALAEGISCYGGKREYTHGGVSLQECLTLEMRVSAEQGAAMASSIHVTDQVWRGMRLTVAIDNEGGVFKLDVRQHAGDASSTIAMSPKPFKNGKASVVIEDDDKLEMTAYVVVLNEDGSLVAQFETKIGGI